MRLLLLLFLVSCSTSSLVRNRGDSFQALQWVALENMQIVPAREAFESSRYYSSQKLDQEKLIKELEKKKWSFLIPREQKTHIEKGESLAVKNKIIIKTVGDFYQVYYKGGHFLVSMDHSPALIGLKNQFLFSSDQKGQAVHEEQNRLIQDFIMQNQQYSQFEGIALAKKIAIGMPERLLMLSRGTPSRAYRSEVDGKPVRVLLYLQDQPRFKIIVSQEGLIESWTSQ